MQLNNESDDQKNDAPPPPGMAPLLFKQNTQVAPTLVETLQLCSMQSLSGKIQFVAQKHYGNIYFHHGQIVHASCGVNEGKDALSEMLQCENGCCTFQEEPYSGKRTIYHTVEQILLETARGNSAMELQPAQSSNLMGGQPKLVIQIPNCPPYVVDIVQDFIHVGRNPTNEIFIDDPSISSRHCLFMKVGHDILIRDLNSTNGTLVNGTPATETTLHIGDIIKLGRIMIRFESGIKRPKLSPVDKKTMRISPSGKITQTMNASTKTSSSQASEEFNPIIRIMAPHTQPEGSSPVLWIAIAVCILAVGAAVYLFLFR